MMSKTLRFFLALLFALALAAVSAAPPRRYSPDELRMVARLASQVLVRNHYLGLAPDRELSHRLFDKYVGALDPGRIYFSVSDIAPFEARRDDLCRKLLEGDCSFALELYKVFRERNREFRAFANDYLKHDIDFTADESYQTDRSKAPRPADAAERRELWRLRLKSDVLYFRLIDRMIDEGGSAGDLPGGNAKQSGKKRQEPAEAAAWKKSPAARVLARLRDIGNAIDKREDIDVLGIYLDALARSLGPHSSYSPPAAEEDFDIHMSQTLTGIGATLTNEDGFIKVVSLVHGGPAARDGRLKVNDRIIAVTEENGETVDVIDMPVDRAVRYIRGKEDTRVTLTVLPGDKGRNAPPVRIDLVRARIVLEDGVAKGRTVELRGTDGKPRRIGVATLPSFYQDINALRRGDSSARRCSTDLAAILEKFNAAKVDAVVLDLRYNPGGSLYEAIFCTGLFITEGPVVQLRGRNEKTKLHSDNDPSVVYRGPLVVLISKASASSSEILAGALRDNNRAVIVGDSRTFGKGTVMPVEELEDSLSFLGSKIPAGRVTYESEMFFRVSGGSTQQLGIASDVVIPSLTEEMKMGEMFLDHHLPWDQVAAVSSANCDPDLEKKIPELRRRSAARVAASREFAQFRRRIEMFRRYRDRDRVSLREETRWKEYQQERDIEKTEAKIAGEDSGKDGDEPDPVLDEAERIASDLAELDGAAKK